MPREFFLDQPSRGGMRLVTGWFPANDWAEPDANGASTFTTILCDRCRNLPGAVFLSIRGDFWSPLVEFRTGRNSLSEIEESREKGCQLCALIWDAIRVCSACQGRRRLDTDRPLWKSTIPIIRSGLEWKLDGKLSDDNVYLLGDFYADMTGAGPAELKIIRGNFVIGLLHFVRGFWSRFVRPHNYDPSSQENFRMIESWLAYCRENHSDTCGRPVRYAAKFGLPTRLIDVSPTDNAGSLRLVLGRDVPRNSTDRRYVALSHCWGKNPSLIASTTKANLQTRIATIPWGDLPKTFQEAVTILRKLSVRYLWIDSLCIVQDDGDDLERECAAMHNVYTCAYFTIAASAAEDSTGGILVAGDPKRFGSCILMSKWKSISNLVTVYPAFAEWDTHLQGPLSSRGWTFQEYQLSPRVIHFTEGRIMWECTDFGGQASEDRPLLDSDKVRPRLIRRLARQDLTNPRLGVLPASPGVKMFKHVRIGRNHATMRQMDDVETEWWHIAIHDYSARKLTCASDKLRALAGYAAALHAYIGQWYLAGIWALDLPQGLLWCPDWEREARIAHSKWPPTSLDPPLPSWTWAAFDGPIKYLSEREYDVNGVEILDFDIEHHHANPFGRFTRGTIKIKTEFAMDVAVNEGDVCERLQPEMVRLPKCYRIFGERQNSIIRKLLHRSRHVDGVIYFDTDPASLPQTVVTCIRLGEGVGRLTTTWNPSSISTSKDIGLALIRVSENDSAGLGTSSGADAGAEKFRRVGMFEVLSGNSKWKAGCAPRVLTLV